MPSDSTDLSALAWHPSSMFGPGWIREGVISWAWWLCEMEVLI